MDMGESFIKRDKRKTPLSKQIVLTDYNIKKPKKEDTNCQNGTKFAKCTK